MQTYLYAGFDGRGRTVSGKLVARDEANLEERLRVSGVWLVEAKPERAKPAGRKRAAGGSGGKRREVINFCTLMEFLIKVGIPVVQALDTAGQDSTQLGFQNVIAAVKKDVEEGTPMADAMQKFPNVFGVQFVSLIRAGERSGSLPESFNELKRYLEWQEGISADIRQATLYPAFVMIATALFILVLFTTVIPKFVKLLALTKVPLPWATQVVFGASDFAKATWWLWLLLLVGGPVMVKVMNKRSQRFALGFDYVKVRVPVLGDLVHMVYISRFARSLAVLYRNGITIINALKLSEGMVGSPIVARAVVDIGKRIESGDSLSEAMRRHDIFPQLLVRMAVMGEKTGNLDAALENVSDYYNLLIPRKVKKLFGMMEPALILTLVGVVGFVAMAVFMPIFSLMDHIH